MQRKVEESIISKDKDIKSILKYYKTAEGGKKKVKKN